MPFLFGITAKEKYICSNLKMDEYEEMLFENRLRNSGISMLALVVGFLAAFISGYIACSWMLNLVKKGKLIWFAVYCFVVGIIILFVH